MHSLFHFFVVKLTQGKGIIKLCSIFFLYTNTVFFFFIIFLNSSNMYIIFLKLKYLKIKFYFIFFKRFQNILNALMSQVRFTFIFSFFAFFLFLFFSLSKFQIKIMVSMLSSLLNIRHAEFPIAPIFAIFQDLVICILI